MKHFIFFVFFFLFIGLTLSAQDEPEKKKDKPVRSPYETAILIDFPTTLNPAKGAWELLIHHRFGTIEDISDLYGIYAPSNIKMTLNYTLFDNITIGFATEKNNKMQDLHWKWTFLNQTRSDRIPVSVSYFGMVGLDARNDDFFGDNYSFTNRFSYFNQLIVSRKFTSRMTLQTGVSFSHFNTVDENSKHDHVGVHLAGRYKIWNSNSFIFEYTYPFKVTSSEELNAPQQGITAGIEFGTSTHGFQVFASNYDGLNPMINVSKNLNNFFEGDILLGFNITIRF